MKEQLSVKTRLSRLSERLIWRLRVKWWTVRNLFRRVIDAWRLKRIDPATLVAPEIPENTTMLTTNDWYGAMERLSICWSEPIAELLIDRWPDSASTSLGVVPMYAKANRQSVMLMESDVRDVVLGLLEDWLVHLDASPPTRDDELIEALDDIRDIVAPHRRVLEAITDGSNTEERESD